MIAGAQYLSMTKTSAIGTFSGWNDGKHQDSIVFVSNASEMDPEIIFFLKNRFMH